MTTVYVVAAGSGDSYRIERVYLNAEQAYGFARDYGRAGGSGAGGGMADRRPAGRLRRPATGARSGGPASRSPSVASMLRRTDEGERFDDFAIRQEWWTGEALPDATVVRRELAGVPKNEVVGLSKEKVEELFWDTITQVRAGIQEIISAILCVGWKEPGMAARLCGPGPS